MRIRLFFSALALTLLLLLPMVGLVEYFAMQRQMQERVRRANAAGTAVQVDPASRYMGSLLLAVQKEEPEFILLRMDAPAATLTLCGLPGNMQLAAPSGTTTLAAAYLAAGPARAAQLLGDTLGTAPQHYLAATPSCYASFWEQGTTVRLDMAALQEDTDPHQNFVAEIEAATAETALRDLGAGQTDAGAARLLAAYTAALFRQNPPAACRPARPGTAGQCPHFNGFAGAGLEHAGKCIQLFQHRPRAGSGNRPAQLHQPPRRGACPDGKRAADGAGGAEDGGRGITPQIAR